MVLGLPALDVLAFHGACIELNGREIRYIILNNNVLVLESDGNSNAIGAPLIERLPQVAQDEVGEIILLHISCIPLRSLATCLPLTALWDKDE